MAVDRLSTPIVSHVWTTSFGAVDAAVARDGTLVYVPESAGSSAARTLVWVDRKGRETPIGAPPRPYAFPRISVDGGRVAMTALDQHPDIWLWDFTRTTLARVTSSPGLDTNPVWTRDGRQIVFTSDRSGRLNLFSQFVDRTDAVEELSPSPNTQLPTAVSPDGTQVVFTELSAKTGADVMALRLEGAHQVVPLVQTPFDERNGAVSSNGRWLAYEANDTGAFEVYVRPFPDVSSGRWQVSTSGGVQPLWAPGGQELFYIAPDGALMGVTVASGPAWSAGVPAKVLDARYVTSIAGNFPRNYDITADGQRFLMLKAGGSGANIAPPQMIVVQHFDEELKHLVPVK
jgi:Tol biopolymer transport system component